MILLFSNSLQLPLHLLLLHLCQRLLLNLHCLIEPSVSFFNLLLVAPCWLCSHVASRHIQLPLILFLSFEISSSKIAIPSLDFIWALPSAFSQCPLSILCNWFSIILSYSSTTIFSPWNFSSEAVFLVNSAPVREARTALNYSAHCLKQLVAVWSRRSASRLCISLMLKSSKWLLVWASHPDLCNIKSTWMLALQSTA